VRTKPNPRSTCRHSPALKQGWPGASPGSESRNKAAEFGRQSLAGAHAFRRALFLSCRHCALAAGMAAFASNLSRVFRFLATQAAVLASFSGGAAAKFVSTLLGLVVSHKLHCSFLRGIATLRGIPASVPLLQSVDIQFTLRIRRADQIVAS
jgi:hypothetical protein